MHRIRLLSLVAGIVIALAFAFAPGEAAEQKPAVIGKDVKGRNFAKQDLKNEDYRGQDLRGADFTFAQLRNASFAGGDLRGAILRDCFCYAVDFTGTDLRGADLLGAKFGDAKMTRANLEDQELYLAGADIHFQMSEEVKRNYTIREAFKPDLRNGTLTFQAANLRNTKILGNLEDVDFRRADLRGADLGKATNVSRANFRGAMYDKGTKWNIDVAEAGATKGEDLAPTAKWFFGVWGIEKDRPGEPAAAKTGRLRILDDGSYEWDTGDDKPLTGKWEALSGPQGGIKLLKGEAGLDWVAQPNKDDLDIKSADGKRARVAFRA